MWITLPCPQNKNRPLGRYSLNYLCGYGCRGPLTKISHVIPYKNIGNFRFQCPLVPFQTILNSSFKSGFIFWSLLFEPFPDIRFRSALGSHFGNLFVPFFPRSVFQSPANLQNRRRNDIE